MSLLKCRSLCTATAAPVVVAPEQTSPVTKRQLDPVQLCIEARCANLRDPEYGTCVLARCIIEYDLKTKKRSRLHSVSKRLLDPLQLCIDTRCADSVAETDFSTCVMSRCIVEFQQLKANKMRSIDSLDPCFDTRCGHLPDPDYGTCVMEHCILAPYYQSSHHRLMTKKKRSPLDPVSVTKRHLNPMQLCIEARCATVREADYGSCVLERCMEAYDQSHQAERKRSFVNTLDNCIKFTCVKFLPSIQSYHSCVQTNCANDIRR